MPKTKPNPTDIAVEAASDIARAHALALKLFGPDVAPTVALAIFDSMASDDDDMKTLEADLIKAKETAKEIFGSEDPGLVMEVHGRVFGDFDE